MKNINRHFLISITLNVLLITLIIFSATYFFIGRNLDYLSKSQNQINQIIVSAIQTENTDTALNYARWYNVGFVVTGETGKKNSLSVNANTLIMRLEFFGRLIQKEITVENSGQKIILTYFRPFMATDDTIKFIPAFIRLFAIFIVFSLVFASFIALANGASIARDIRNARNFAAKLVKGSSHTLSGKAGFQETQELFNELNSLQELVLKKEELKKRMTTDIAHELRTPLTTLQSHLEALIDGIWQPTKERFISCHEEILRLIRIVADLEKLSKFEDENLKLKKSRFDIRELLRSIHLNFQGELNHKKMSIIINGGEQSICADKDKISQVFVNLISNSLKYSSYQGKLLIDIKGDKEYVYVVINDNGIGIPSRDIQNVFNRLYRTDVSRARDTGGAGIGLTIAKSIIEAHRGSIDIVSQEGLGTEMTVILPKNN